MGNLLKIVFKICNKNKNKKVVMKDKSVRMLIVLDFLIIIIK